MASRSFAPFTCNTYLQFWSSRIFLTLLIRYYVNRDTLFSYHKASEVFLQRLMALYVASHYKVITSFVSCILWADKCLFWQIYEGFQTRCASHLVYHTGSINRASFFFKRKLPFHFSFTEHSKWPSAVIRRTSAPYFLPSGSCWSSSEHLTRSVLCPTGKNRAKHCTYNRMS